MEQMDLAVAVGTVIAERLQKNFQIIPTLTLDQAAEALGVSNETMRKICQEGKIPYIRMDRLYRLKPADVNAYLEANYHPAKTEKDQHEAR